MNNEPPEQDPEIALPLDVDLQDQVVSSKGSAIVPGLDDPSLYINREFSLLQFNARVLKQTQDKNTPLLERLRFLTICSTNLDEFFEIRVGSLLEQLRLDIGGMDPSGLTASETLKQAQQIAHSIVDEQYRILGQEILPELDAEGIHLIPRPKWNEKVRKWSTSYFNEQVIPVITPIGLDPAHPFPTIVNKSLNFIVSLDGKDAYGRSSGLAVVQAPSPLPRIFRLPESLGLEGENFVTLSGIIHENIKLLFPGMKVKSTNSFRLTRNSDLWIDEEETDDLMRALKGELSRRRYGEAVRLEVNLECAEEMSDFLLEQFDLDENALYRVDGPVNIYRLSKLCDIIDRPDLSYKPFTPGAPKSLKKSDDIFASIRQNDILLHHPFQSFTPVVELLKQSAHDPAVKAIKVTLYRTGVASPLTDALIEAANSGKEVTVVIELRARFDEAENIDIATKLQGAGAKVVYGIVGYKAHAKMMLIVRQEGTRLRRYVHLGTGNYHTKNTKSYTDFGLLTCDDELAEDVHQIFQQLTGLGKAARLKRMLQAPFSLHTAIKELIEQETQNALDGKPARIRAKMNALVEPKIIRALYRASQAGVQIDLIVRGICSLRPGIPGISDNIRVRSIISRFLEHSRIFNFHANGADITWCSSADWMPRNFFRRVETAFRIERGKLRRRVIDEGLVPYIRDNVRAWHLQSDGSYVRIDNTDKENYDAQLELLHLLADA